MNRVASLERPHERDSGPKSVGALSLGLQMSCMADDGEPEWTPHRHSSTNRVLPRREEVGQLLAALVMKLLMGEVFTSV
jgi:hypothetical protein